jgi:hypothetical protein
VTRPLGRRRNLAQLTPTIRGLFPDRPNIYGDLMVGAGVFGDGERAAVAEEQAEELVGYVDLDPEPLDVLIPPLADVGDPREDEREPEGQPPS